MDVPASLEKSKDRGQSQETEKFKPGRKLLFAFAAIAIVNLACALDATVVSVALPVCRLFLISDLDSGIIY
jgi:hypothetical protein